MRKRRKPLDIYATILKAISKRKGITKTHLTYHANVSYRQLQTSLDMLLKLNLIKPSELEGRISYEVTNKGRLFLESYERLRKLLTVQNETTHAYTSTI